MRGICGFLVKVVRLEWGCGLVGWLCVGLMVLSWIFVLDIFLCRVLAPICFGVLVGCGILCV